MCETFEIDIRRDQRDAPRGELPGLHRAPRVEADDELRRAQKHVRPAGLTELHAAEHRFGAVPAPAQTELVETQVEPRLGAYEPLQRGPVFGHPRKRQLVSDDYSACERRNGGASQDAGTNAPATQKRRARQRGGSQGRSRRFDVVTRLARRHGRRLRKPPVLS